MRVVQSVSGVNKASAQTVEAAETQQLLQVMSDFSMAYRQRDNVANALAREKQQFERIIGAVEHILHDGINHDLRDVALLLGSLAPSVGSEKAARSRIVPALSSSVRALLSMQALSFWLGSRHSRTPQEVFELADVLKQAVDYLRPLYEAAGGGIGIGESCPGVNVSGSRAAVRHILLNTLAEFLNQADPVKTCVLSMASIDDSVQIRINSAGVAAARPSRKWDSDAPGLSMARDIAHDFGVIYEISPSGAGGDCRIELARARAA